MVIHKKDPLMESSLYYKLLEILEKQKELLQCKDNLIAGLVNENCEKENMLNQIAKQEEYLY